MRERVFRALDDAGDGLSRLAGPITSSETWHRMGGFSFDTWHSLISAFCWGLTFAVLFFKPLKDTREWTPLAAGLTAISGILALLLLTTVVNIIYPPFNLGLTRYLFRDVGTIINIIILQRVFWPGKSSYERSRDEQ